MPNPPYNPYFDDDETCFVKELQTMNSAAWSHLCAKYSDALHLGICTSLRMRGLSVDHAPDIEQETWLTAVHLIGKFASRGPGKLYNWLRAISARHVMNFKKRQQRQANHVDEDEIDREFLLTGSLSEKLTPENEVLLRDEIRAVQGALKELPQRDAEMVVRWLYWEQKPRELAAIYGLEVNSVHKALNRALRNIKAYYLAHRLFQPRTNTSLRQPKKDEEADE